MIQDLFRLFNKYHRSIKTPLEDFNTETFAGILKLYPTVKNILIEELWELPPDNYKVKTLVKKNLDNDKKCISDLVFEGEENICFIENKVDSTEGDRQLERYSLSLQKHFPNKTHHLYYCTKNCDPKNQNDEFEQYNFKQFRWYQIAKILSHLSKDNSLIKNYLNFLLQQNMAQDNTIRIENLLSIKNLSKSIEILDFYIDNSLDDFSKLFKPTIRSKSKTLDQIRNQNRACVYHEYPLEDSKGVWSEILYGINLENLYFYTQIFIGKDHDQYSQFYEKATNQNDFILEESEYGIALIIKQDLGVYINNENAENEIKNWFKKTFKCCKNFITNTPDLVWKNIKISCSYKKEIQTLLHLQNCNNFVR